MRAIDLVNDNMAAKRIQRLVVHIQNGGDDPIFTDQQGLSFLREGGLYDVRICIDSYQIFGTFYISVPTATPKHYFDLFDVDEEERRGIYRIDLFRPLPPSATRVCLDLKFQLSRDAKDPRCYYQEMEDHMPLQDYDYAWLSGVVVEIKKLLTSETLRIKLRAYCPRRQEVKVFCFYKRLGFLNVWIGRNPQHHLFDF